MRLNAFAPLRRHGQGVAFMGILLTGRASLLLLDFGIMRKPSYNRSLFSRCGLAFVALLTTYGALLAPADVNASISAVILRLASLAHSLDSHPAMAATLADGFHVAVVASPKTPLGGQPMSPAAIGLSQPASVPSNTEAKSSLEPQFYVSVFAALISFVVAGFQFFALRRNINQKSNEEELQQLKTKLEVFYGPFLLLSEANNLLHRDLRARVNPDLRLLTALLEPRWITELDAGDQTIVGEICRNGKELEKMIADHAGLVDEKVLPYLARASAHYRMLFLAYEGKLGSNPSSFERYIFPLAMPKVVALEVDRIKKRRDRLRERPAEQFFPMRPLRIPKNLELRDWPDPPIKLDA